MAQHEHFRSFKERDILMESTTRHKQNHTDRPLKNTVVRMLRPSDVCDLDKKLCEVNWTSNKLVLNFSECIDLADFCRRYRVKISDESVNFVWSEPLRCLRIFVENKLIDVNRHCFDSSLCVYLPAHLLQPGRTIYFYTMVRNLTFGNMFRCD
jgi:hypothetical protein